VCKAHREKNCLVGNGMKGYGCPVREYPGNMDNNAFCTLCTECIKTCPKDNITFRFRPFARDLANLTEKRLGLDMSILAVVLLGLPTFQTMVMIEPWEGWMDWLRQITGLPQVAVFSSVFLVGTLLVPLGLFSAGTAATTALTRRQDVTFRRVFINFAFAFVPIGLLMHLAHNVKHLFGESHVAVPVLSDPFGWGWNLVGTAGLELSSPFSTDLLTKAQYALILLGHGFAVYVSYRIARRLLGEKADRFVFAVAPILLLTVAWSVFNLWVLNMPLMDRH
jgi:ferredoxin